MPHAPHVWEAYIAAHPGAPLTRLYCNGESLDPPGFVRSPNMDQMTPAPTLLKHAPSPTVGQPTRPTCMHIDFAALVEVHRLFTDDVAESEALTHRPDSVTVDVTVSCVACGAKVRFEGPIGVEVGPGAQPCVSMDGTELRATGHLGENRTPGVRVRLAALSANPDGLPLRQCDKSRPHGGHAWQSLTGQHNPFYSYCEGTWDPTDEYTPDPEARS